MAFKLKKNEKYIFATDLDGTFLTDFNGSLHIDSFEAVRKIKEAGHHFVIATGRSWWWTETLYKQLESTDASIHFSGAIVHHPNDKNFDEFRTSLSQVVMKDLIKKLDIWKIANRIQAVGRKQHAYWNNGDDFDKLFFNCYELIIAFDEDKISPDELIKRIEDIIGEGYMIRTWHFSFAPNETQIIISPQKTNKASALDKIAKYYDIKRENVIYFGDNINDLEALEWAGHSFVPKNAKEVAIKAADEVLKLTNNEGAVPKKILDLLK